MKKIATTAAVAAILITAACSSGGDSNDAPTTTRAASASAATPAAKAWTLSELSGVVTPMGYACKIEGNMVCSSPNNETIWQFYRVDEVTTAWWQQACESGTASKGDVLTNGAVLIQDTVEGQESLTSFKMKLEKAGVTGFRLEPNCPRGSK